MTNLVPSKIFFTRGVGRDKAMLRSFEEALRDAGIAQFNLVSVSSILPPEAEIISREEGLKYLKPGQILFTVLARNQTDELNRMASAAIGYAIPKDRSRWGYLSEHHSFGQTEKKAGFFAEKLAAEMLASTLGKQADLTWNNERESYILGDQILQTGNICSTAFVMREEEWTTVVSAAVLIIE